LFNRFESFCLASMVVYQYVCCCDWRYVGRNTLRLQDRINQTKSSCNKQIPTKILSKRKCKENTKHQVAAMWFSNLATSSTN